MPVSENIGRRQSIPVLYTKGTHYEVGFDIGRTFGTLIHSFVNSFESLNDEYVPAYETPAGKKIYDDTLANLNHNFPQYIKELEGIADGSKVPFFKLFLLHIDDVMTMAVKKDTIKEPTGCTSVSVNLKDKQLIGHTEDALNETVNHYYFVSAHIIEDKPYGRYNVKEERFTSLCYAGHLPGYTMNYNHHGLVFSINTISAKDLIPGNTPRHFITRALLATKNFDEAMVVLKDAGHGTANACSINMRFIKENNDLLRNIEIGPNRNSSESMISVLPIQSGHSFIHVNQFQRLPLDQANPNMLASSKARLESLSKHKSPTSKSDVRKMLGDTTREDFNVFLGRPTDRVQTIAVGIFDLHEKTWSIYSDNPALNEPLVVLPLLIKK